jgi:hypothetical protein
MLLLAAGVLRPAWGQVPTVACALLTPDQVTAALGAQVGAGSSFASHVCSWYVTGTPKGVTLILYPPKKWDVLKKLAASYGASKTSLDGVGDEAVFGVIPNFAATLSVRKGEVVYLVRVEGFAFDKNGTVPRKVEETERALARAVLAKL